jgi:hypothetical protein
LHVLNGIWETKSPTILAHEWGGQENPAAQPLLLSGSTSTGKGLFAEPFQE